MTLAARRGSGLRLPIRNGFLGKPDRQASAIAKRRVVVTPIDDPAFLTGNMVPTIAMESERHDCSPGVRRETSGLILLKMAARWYPCAMAFRGKGSA